jgi:uncharacterized membrane protein
MNKKILSRIIAALVMAVLAAVVVRILDSHDYSLSREAYLAKQATEFDEKVTHPRSFFGYLILGFIASCLYFGLYEVLSLFVRKLLERLHRSDSNT